MLIFYFTLIYIDYLASWSHILHAGINDDAINFDVQVFLAGDHHSSIDVQVFGLNLFSWHGSNSSNRLKKYVRLLEEIKCICRNLWSYNRKNKFVSMVLIMVSKHFSVKSNYTVNINTVVKQIICEVTNIYCHSPNFGKKIWLIDPGNSTKIC